MARSFNRTPDKAKKAYRKVTRDRIERIRQQFEDIESEELDNEETDNDNEDQA